MFVLVGLVPLLLGVVLVGYQDATVVRGQNQREADREAARTAENIGRVFTEWRNELLVAAQDDTLKAWFRSPPVRESTRTAIDAGLLGLSRLYPDLVDEACFIDASGQEIARVVYGKLAPVADLSSDEASAAFFAPTMTLPEFQVHQNRPYVSADSDRWVVSNSTPIYLDGRPVAYCTSKPASKHSDSG